jgi:hypothetical protein
MVFNRWLIALVFTTSCVLSNAQEVDSLFLKDELTSEDSLSIFRLIDSLMTIESIEASQLVARVSYNSNVLSAGRTLGIEQFGLSPGVSYYHKSGMYADLTSYWSKDYDPHLYLTTTSIGYIHVFSRRFSAIATYDHYFYHQNDDDTFLPYSNAITVSPSLDFNLLSLRLDYSFYFGDAYANRIMPNVSFKIRKNDFLGFDRVSIYPSCYVLFGDEAITDFELVAPTTIREAYDNYQKYGMRFSPETTERIVFGVMNYSFSLPITMTINNWLFNVGYTYSIPVALEDEPLTLEQSGFVSAGISYFISLKPVK